MLIKRILQTVFCVCVLSEAAIGQDGIGIPSMKIIPGARQAGMAGTVAGIGDDIYTIYANPGGLGHLRRWQWSLGYNRWFGDVYQADAAFVKQLRMWGSTKTGFGLFASMVGMPAWDATGGKDAAVSADSWNAGIALGQRLDWLDRSLALGINVKVIHNRLATYSSTSPAMDAGLLFKPGRFRLGALGLGIFDYGIFSAGVSVLHVGPGVVFVSERTLLPTTLRTGGALHVGRYDGWSCLLALDWTKVRGDNGFVSAGTEIWWKDFLGCRAGFRADGRDLGDFSFGFGLRWENAIASLLGLPSRFGDAFQADFAEAGYGDAMKQAYRGAVVHFPLSPEPFKLNDPQERKSETRDGFHSVQLEWEKAYDPDPFDEVRYLLMLDQSKPKIESAVTRLERDKHVDAGTIAAVRQGLFFTDETRSNGYFLQVKEGGIYHWAVVAFDLANHVQVAKKGSEKIGRFLVAVPDLIVKAIRYSPIDKINTTPDQGTLFIDLGNQGSEACERFNVLVRAKPVLSRASNAGQTAFSGNVFNLAVGKDTTLSIPWKTDVPGWYEIRAEADPDSAVVEYREDNNSKSIRAATVPKGKISAPDSVEVMVTGYDSQEIPMVPEVYFGPQSNTVDSSYFGRERIFPSLLPTVAERLIGNPGIHLKLFGSIDYMSGEKEPDLADQRAENVRTEIERLGVPPERMEVVKEHPHKILGKGPLPPNPQDAEWVEQQNRVVTFSVRTEDEETMFQPYRFAVDTTMRDSVQFRIRVISGSGIRQWNLGSRSSMLDVRKRNGSEKDSLSGDFSWKGTDQGKVIVGRNRWVPYALILTDTLGRAFSTDNDSIYIQEKRTVRRQELFGAAKFAQVEPVYAFYWDRVMGVAKEMIEDTSLRLRFEGHACAIGPAGVNDRLSLQRARAFSQAFLERVGKAYPLEYQSIVGRIAPPIGFGKREPLVVRLKGYGDLLLGDNRLPIGRYLNRRIAILLYREH